MKHRTITLTLSLLSSLLVDAAPMPLAKSYWNSEGFLKAFHASYRTNARIEPYITSEEKSVLLEMQQLMARGARQEAIQALKSSPKTQGSAALNFNLGNLYFEEGQLEAARNSYQKSLKLYPSFRRAHKNLGLVFMRLENIEQAQPCFVEAVQLGDMSGSTLGLLGYCHAQGENHASALQAYQLARLTEPENASWMAGVAQSLLAMDKLREGLAMIAEVYKLRPKEDGYAQLYVHALIQNEQNDKAIAVLELLRKQQRLTFPQRCQLAQLHCASGDMRMAQPRIEELLNANDSFAIIPFLNVIESLGAMGEWRLVLDLLQKIEVYERNPAEEEKFQHIHVRSMAHLGMPEAAPMLASLLDVEPLDGELLVLMAKLQQSLDQAALAEVYFERAELTEGHAYRAFLAHGAMLVEQKRYQRALEKYRAAQKIQATPEQAKYIEQLRKVVVSQGDRS